MDPSLHQPHSKLPKGFIISVLLFTIFMLTVPFGVYLVQQRTNFQPQASKNNGKAETVMFLEAEKPETNGNLKVKVMLSSDSEQVNLVDSRIQYPPDLLAVDTINTSDLSNLSGSERVSGKWIQKDFDNSKGDISLLLGIPEGLQTEPGKAVTLAVINFKARSLGSAKIVFNQESSIYKSTDNTKILIPKKDISVDLTASSSNIREAHVACKERPECLDAQPACQVPEPEGGWCSGDEASLEIVSPNGGEIYNYKNPVPILWKAKNSGDISIALLLNGSILGKIATASAEAGSYLWNPLQTLTYAFIYPYNAFQIQIESITEKNELRAVSEGPFTLTLEETGFESSESGRVKNGNGDINGDGSVDLADLSVMVSNYRAGDEINNKADLNGDGIVNDIDLWLLSKAIQ